MQFAEGLSDRQAADAVRSRIDWKSALSLELSDPGFDRTVLSEFRTRLAAGQAEQVKDRAPAAELIASPYDADARYSMKRDLQWVGYKVHLTETCDDDQPHLITQVITTPATTPDCVMGPPIHQDLAQRDLLPSVHLLDGGYVDAELLVAA
jgi:IS5 family transposase